MKHWRHLYGVASCLIFWLCSGMSCEAEVVGTLTEIEVLQYNNAEQEPELIEDGRCPKEAYRLRVFFRKWDNWESWYDVCILSSPIVDFRIITIGDFNKEYPAGSDVYALFKEYPKDMMMQYYTNFIPDTLKEGIPIGKVGYFSFLDKVLLTYPEAGRYQFRIELELKDGTIVSDETEPVELY